MLKIQKLVQIVMFAILLMIAGCPQTVVGHVWRVNAFISPQPVDQIRSQILSLGRFERVQMTGSSACGDRRHYDGFLPQSHVRVRIYDCYRKSDSSETGWVYSINVAVATAALTNNERSEIDGFVEDIRKAVQDSVGRVKITVVDMEMTREFSLLPY